MTFELIQLKSSVDWKWQAIVVAQQQIMICRVTMTTTTSDAERRRKAMLYHKYSRELEASRTHWLRAKAIKTQCKNGVRRLDELLGRVKSEIARRLPTQPTATRLLAPPTTSGQ